MSNKINLTFAIPEAPHLSKIRNGSIAIEGVEAEMLTIQPQIAAFRRMVRGLEFDVCSLAPTTYYCARAYGIPIIALPIFVHRGFHHGGLKVNPNSGVKTPKDLEGKKVGVRAYSVTSGVWIRSILIDEFGLDSSKVTWVVDDEEHVTQLKLPPNVIKTTPDRSLADMMADGELAAGVGGLAGVGRKGSPTEGWKTVATEHPDLIPNAKELEAEWYKRTGIYPMHDTIVVKESVIKENPWLAKSLFNAFTKAKYEWLPTLDSGNLEDKNDIKYAGLREIVGPDPLPFGIEANLPAIKFLEEASFKQGLMPKRMSIEELFLDPETM